MGNNSGPSDSLFRWVLHLKNVNLTIQNYFPPQKKLTTEFPHKNSKEKFDPRGNYLLAITHIYFSILFNKHFTHYSNQIFMRHNLLLFSISLKENNNATQLENYN